MCLLLPMLSIHSNDAYGQNYILQEGFYKVVPPGKSFCTFSCFLPLDYWDVMHGSIWKHLIIVSLHEQANKKKGTL